MPWSDDEYSVTRRVWQQLQGNLLKESLRCENVKQVKMPEILKGREAVHFNARHAELPCLSCRSQQSQVSHSMVQLQQQAWHRGKAYWQKFSTHSQICCASALKVIAQAWTTECCNTLQTQHPLHGLHNGRVEFSRSCLSFTGEICWKAAAEGPCLANTKVMSAGPGHNGSLSQASFDYATVLTPGTPFSAVALYRGSMLCKSAPSDNMKEPPPEGVIMVRRPCYF